MGISVNGKEIETTPSGFLVNIEEWSEDLALEIAKEEAVELTEKHWDIINYLKLYLILITQFANQKL